jgi:regulator of protease activity HflC (stomatin/prohibitin superfamily)
MNEYTKKELEDFMKTGKLPKKNKNNGIFNKGENMPIKKVVTGVIAFVVAIFLLISAGSLVETVDKGTYHITQAAVTGEMGAQKQPGLYAQMFADVTVWPNAETFFFTKDKDSADDIDQDLSIEVRFNDGSMARISGTCRITMPVTAQDSIDLVNKFSYTTYKSLQQKAILPVIREAVRNTSNLMSARESYSERRSDFVSMARDQAVNGVYLTEQYSEKVNDPVSGELVTRTYNRIKRGEDGKPIRESNLLNDIGVTLSNFEIKTFEYEQRVIDQIKQQQEAIMAVATAKAQAQRAEQDALTSEAQGKAKVMTAKYQKEEEKVRAEVDAEKEKAVAVKSAEKERDVMALSAEKAKLEAAQIQTLADADFYQKEKEAAGRKALLLADNALSQKLQAWVQAQGVWAKAFESRKVPSVVMGGSGGTGTGSDSDVQTFMQILGVKAAKDLALDMNIGGQK